MIILLFEILYFVFAVIVLNIVNKYILLLVLEEDGYSACNKIKKLSDVNTKMFGFLSCVLFRLRAGCDSCSDILFSSFIARLSSTTGEGYFVKV